ncbi:MAG: hypothetical protein FJ128_03080, partial [Deltaproteobacteria bacterium]|nr:hypothetical protein [Deltaproteobacteria bacterium]
MAIRFSLFYHTPENGDYLQRVITSAPQASIVERRSLDELPAHVNSGSNAIFLEYQADAPGLDQWIRKTAADFRNPPIFLFFKEITTEQLWRALRLGVKECFASPIRPEEFQEALARLPLAPLEPGEGSHPRQIALLGAKGGVGTSFLTINLAYCLAQLHKRPVLAVDLDLRYGQLVYFLDAKPQYTIIDIIENLDRLDDSYLQGLLFRCGDNLQLLPAPRRMEEAEMVAAEQMARVLDMLKKHGHFSAVVVDAGHQLDEVTLRALDLADRVLLVAAQSICALSNARKIMEILPLLGLTGAGLELWINLWRRRGDLGIREIQDFLGREVSATIPEAQEEVERSINEGRPLAQTNPQHQLCRDLRAQAERLLGAEEKEERASLWSRLNI